MQRARDEAEIEMVLRALRSAAKPSKTPETLPLPTVVNELEAWLRDPHQWGSAFSDNWKSLIEDLERSLTACGPELRETLDVGEPSVTEELVASRKRLSGANRAADASLRRRLEQVTARLERQLLEGNTARAAFNDLRSAARSNDEGLSEKRAGILLDLTSSSGHSERTWGSSVASILNDSAYEIALARGAEELPESPHERAGATVEERVDLVRRFLARPARRGSVVVWLRYELAKVGWPPYVELGDRVTLYDDGWLKSMVQSGDLSNLPSEIQQHPDWLKIFLGIYRQRDELPAGEDDDESGPVAYIRMDFGDIVVAHAERLSLQTAEAVASLASLYGLSPSIWRPTGGWISYVDGQDGAASFGGRASTGGVEEHIALSEREYISDTLSTVAEVLGPALPVTDSESEIAEVCTLLAWLRQARQAPSPARLLLCDRVIEQVSGWAGIDDVAYFVREHIGPAWAYRRMRQEVARVGWGVERKLNELEITGDTVTMIYGEQWGLKRQLNLRALLEHLSWLLEQLPAGSEEEKQVRRLNERCRNGRATAAWWRELQTSFNVLQSRARRTRNVLMHGGPLVEETVDTIVDFADAIAADALNVALRGRAARHDLVDDFLDRRVTFERSQKQLSRNQPASEALFWAGDA